MIVRRILDDYPDGLSPRHVAAKLKEDDIASLSDGKWNDITIRGNAKKTDGTLRNEAYAAFWFKAVTTSWANAAIERLLDRLGTDEAGEALLARLKACQVERDALRQQLSASTKQQEIILPTQAELEAVYSKQVAHLEAILTGSDQIVAANALLRQMLAEVRVWGDPEAQDEVHRAERRGRAAAATVWRNGRKHPGRRLLSSYQISLVAGARIANCFAMSHFDHPALPRRPPLEKIGCGSTQPQQPASA